MSCAQRLLALCLLLGLAPASVDAGHEPAPIWSGERDMVPTAFSKREVMDLSFAEMEMSAFFVARVKKTPTDYLQLLGKRAVFTVQHDDSDKAKWNARKVLDLLRRLGVTVPGDVPPPPPPPPPQPPTPPTPPPPPQPPTPPTPPPPQPPTPPTPPTPPPPQPPTPPTPPPPPPPEPPPTPPPPTPPTPPPPPPPEPPPTPPTPPTPPPPTPPGPPDGNGPPIQPGEEFSVVDYYPMYIGNKFKYVDLAVNNLKFTMEIKKTVQANGKACMLNERDDKIETDAIAADADGIYLHEQQRTNSDGTLFHAVWTPPVKFAANRVKFGDKFTTIPGFLNPGTGNTMSWVSTIYGIQDVTVPAGKFKNCVRIKVLVTDTKLGVKLSDFEMWVAKGIGVVQRQGNFFGVYFVQKLLEFKLGQKQ